MTPNEFKAWFQGFVEGIEGVPSVKQWERIKERVNEIDGKPVTATVFVDRYWPRYPWPYPHYPYWGGFNQAQGLNLQAQNLQNQCMNANNLANIGQNEATYRGMQMGQHKLNDGFDLYREALQSAQSGQVSESFDSEAAMRELGRKDYSNLNGY